MRNSKKIEQQSEKRGYFNTPTLGDMFLQFCIKWTDLVEEYPWTVGLSMLAVVLGLGAASGAMFEFLPLLTAIVVFALPYGVGLLANKYKADLSTPDTRKGNAWMFAKGGIIAGLFLSSVGVIGAVFAQLSGIATMNSIAMAITNAGIVVVNAVAGIAGAGTVTALTSMTTLGTIAVFAGAAGVLMVVLSAVSALAGSIRFSSTAEALSFYQTPIKDGDKGYEEVRTYYENYLQNHAFGANQARWNKAKQLYKDGYTLGDLDSQDPKKKTPEKRALDFLNASEPILDAEVKSNKHLEKTYLSDACTNQCAENVKRLFTPPQDQSESTETDQINVPIADERVPDALFDASIQESTKVFVMIAANADRPGGGLWWGTAQEEAVYASTNLVLYAAPFYKMPSSESPLKPLSRMGYTYVQHDATAFKEISTGFNCKTFSPIYAANPDFRKYYSMAQDHLLTSKGHQEFISISYTNYYQTIAHAAEFKEQNHDQNTLIKLNAIGCGAFFNPHFLVAATARLAIEDARGDFPTCMPNFQFSIAGNSSNDQRLRATFDRIMNQTSLKDVRLMLDRGSPSYREEMLAFAKQREPDQRSYGDSEHGPGDFLNKIKAQMKTSGPLEVSPSPSNTLSIPAGSAPSPTSKSRAAASSTDSAASRGPGSGSNQDS